MTPSNGAVSTVSEAFGDPEGRLGGVEVRLRDQLFLEQPGHAVTGELGLLQGRGGPLHEGGLFRHHPLVAALRG
jgi:hypothetical protein